MVELNRKTRRFFLVGSLVPKKLKQARVITFLIKELCHKCEHATGGKIKQPKIESEKCLSCIGCAYRTIYGEDM